MIQRHLGQIYKRAESTKSQIASAVYHALYPGVYDRSRAHRAGLHSDVKRHAGKSPAAESRAGALNTLYRYATVEDVKYGSEEILATAVVDDKAHGMLKEFDPAWREKEEE